MNIIEVSKKENIGKSYEIVIDGMRKGVWELRNEFNTEEFDFYRDGGEPLTEIYFISQITKMEFKEVIDWSKVPVDTKMLVSNDGENWHKRYFAKYEVGEVYCFSFGATSFSNDNISYVAPWKYVKLYEE